ncbi:ABC transporter substrate-binding protein [Lacisediminimonas profundi]|uniref:ABC transporter substrate-binding protein n=1 Tax=Lacisediminimonas profundi TaxID=2603856 RepID=UPI001F4F80D6|nr:ABC transporter substrate-binding protein [Lacisediminimonas profundi]
MNNKTPYNSRIKLNRRSLLRTVATATAAAGFALAAAAPAMAQQGISDGVVKIGLILDMSGVYADISGKGSATAAQLAIEDFGGAVLGKKIELVVADHQLKPDNAASRARQWFDQDKVDAIHDVTGSAASLAVLQIAKEKNRIAVFNGPATERFTNDLCTPVSAHYAYDSYALANTVARALVNSGKKDWYFLTVDYAGGHDLEKNAAAAVLRGGGKVVGSVRHPLGASDFSSFVVQAQASRASVIGLANAGGDTINAIKAARDFGIGTGNSKQILAATLLYINDIHALGLPATQGMVLAEGFYWDLNAETRAWSRRYFERMKRMPNMSQAGVYSSVLHYLKAVKAAGTDDTAAVMRKMKELPVNDFFAKNGRIREDGRMVHDMYLFKVKTPAESKYPWDYYTHVGTVPGKDAFRPLSESACPLLKKS